MLPVQGMLVQSLVGELRSYMLRGTAKINIKIIETEPESFLIERESREVK